MYAEEKSGPLIGRTERQLLAAHKLHEGLYARVAEKLRVDASYVSKVVSGSRSSRKVLAAVLAELKRLERRKALLLM